MHQWPKPWSAKGSIPRATRVTSTATQEILYRNTVFAAPGMHGMPLPLWLNGPSLQEKASYRSLLVSDLGAVCNVLSLAPVQTLSHGLFLAPLLSTPLSIVSLAASVRESSNHPGQERPWLP